MAELTVKKSELRVRQKRNTNGYLPIWEVISVIMYSDGTVTRTVLCERDSQEAALAVIERDYSKPETDTTEKYTVTELSVKKLEFSVRQKMGKKGYLPAWEVISNVMYCDGTVSCTVLCEMDSKDQAMAIKQECSSSGQSDSCAVTLEMIQAAEKAQNYDYVALYDHFPSMLPVDVILKCKEIMEINDTLEQLPRPMAFYSLNSDGFTQSIEFLQSFCMEYLVNIFFADRIAEFGNMAAPPLKRYFRM